MATKDTSSDSTTGSTETGTQGTTGTGQQGTEETSDQTTDDSQTQDDATSDSTTDDKAVKTEDRKDPAKQALLADLNKERKDLKATRTERDTLKTEVESLRPMKETLDAVQGKYDRLEEFLQAVGGPLGKALDSKAFTTRLFGTEDKIEDIVKKWNTDNPSATSTALGAGAAAPASKAPDMNDLLRSAIK